MAETGTPQIAGPVNRVFQETLLRNAKARCPYFAGSLPAEVTEHRGTFTALWRRFTNMTPTVSALSEITSESYPFRTGTALAVVDVTAVVSKYGQVVFLTEEVDLINFNGQTEKIVEVLGISAGRSLNRLQRNHLEDNAGLIYAGAATQDSEVADPISLELIRNGNNAINRLDALKFNPMTTGADLQTTTPIRETYIGLTHVDVEEDIRDLGKFTPVEQYASQTGTLPGEFGTSGGIRWVSSTEASIDTTGGADAPAGIRATAGKANLYTSVILGMDAHGSLGLGTRHVKEIYRAGDKLPSVIMINHARGSGGTFDPLNETSTLSWKSWHAPVILNGDWLRGLRHAARTLGT